MTFASDCLENVAQSVATAISVDIEIISFKNKFFDFNNIKLHIYFIAENDIMTIKIF